MKAYWGVEVQLYILLTSELDGEWSASRPGRFNPRERAPGTHWTGDWVGPDLMEVFYEIGNEHLGSTQAGNFTTSASVNFSSKVKMVFRNYVVMSNN
jgi:hypothetical protein